MRRGLLCWVCVCLSVKSHLTSGASVRPDTVVHSAGIKKFVGFSLKPLSRVMA